MSPHLSSSQSIAQGSQFPESLQPVASRSFVFTSSRYMASSKPRPVASLSRPSLPEHLRRIHAGQAHNLHSSSSGASSSSTSTAPSTSTSFSSRNGIDRPGAGRSQLERPEQAFRERERAHANDTKHDFCPSARFILPFSIHTSIPLKPTKYHDSSTKSSSPLPTPSRSRNATAHVVPSPRLETDLSLTEIFYGSGPGSYFASGVYDNLPVPTAPSSNVLETFNKKAMSLKETPLDLKLPDPVRCLYLISSPFFVF
jgi:hypothetical protein